MSQVSKAAVAPEYPLSVRTMDVFVRSTARIAVYFNHGKLKKHDGVLATIRLWQTDHKNSTPHVQSLFDGSNCRSQTEEKVCSSSFDLSIRRECTCVRTCDTSPNPPSFYHTHLLLTSASSWKKRRTKKADKDSKNIQQNSQRLTIRLTETVNYTTINCPCGPKYQISMFPIVILRYNGRNDTL